MLAPRFLLAVQRCVMVDKRSEDPLEPGRDDVIASVKRLVDGAPDRYRTPFFEHLNFLRSQPNYTKAAFDLYRLDQANSFHWLLMGEHCMLLIARSGRARHRPKGSKKWDATNLIVLGGNIAVLEWIAGRHLSDADVAAVIKRFWNNPEVIKNLQDRGRASEYRSDTAESLRKQIPAARRAWLSADNPALKKELQQVFVEALSSARLLNDGWLAESGKKFC